MRQTTVPFNNNPIISSSNHITTILYKGSADCCEIDQNSDIICLLQQSQAIHNCNQSLLTIFPDLSIFIFSITNMISFQQAPWYSCVYYVRSICITKKV